MLLVLALLGIAFDVGEDLEYEAKYGFLSVGRMRLAVVAETVVKGDSVYRFVSDVSSNPKYRVFFWLKDRLESYSRKNDLLPLIFTKDIHEKNYEKKVTIEYDHENLAAKYSDGTQCAILPASYDLLGFYYRIREMKLALGDTAVINNHTDKKNYAVKVTALRREKVKTQFGEWDCILYEPQTKEKGVFGRDGKLLIWVSDDETRMPVMIKSRMSIGSLTFRIARFVRGGGR